MQITIDTKTDSYEDIQKVFHILANILEKKGLNNGLNENLDGSSETNSANLMSMFDTSETKTDQPNTAPNFSSFLNLVNNGKKEDRSPGIQIY